MTLNEYALVVESLHGALMEARQRGPQANQMAQELAQQFEMAQMVFSERLKAAQKAVFEEATRLSAEAVAPEPFEGVLN